MEETPGLQHFLLQAMPIRLSPPQSPYCPFRSQCGIIILFNLSATREIMGYFPPCFTFLFGFLCIQFGFPNSPFLFSLCYCFFLFPTSLILDSGLGPLSTYVHSILGGLIQYHYFKYHLDANNSQIYLSSPNNFLSPESINLN